MNPNDRQSMLIAVLYLIGNVAMMVSAWHFMGWAGGVGALGLFSFVTAILVSK